MKNTNTNKASLIKKCHMKFSSLYNNPLSETSYNNNMQYNKIKVNKHNNKFLSPTTNLRNHNRKIINKNKLNSNKNKTKNLNNNCIKASLNYCKDFKDINYIKYISINVDINKITLIQIWWKYIYKVIFLQKNIKGFIIKKSTKKKLKYYNFILSIIKIFYRPFINNMKLCYKRYYFQKWKEINNKKCIIKKILLNKKIRQKEKRIYSINNSILYENNKANTIGNIKKIVFNNSSVLKDKILSPYRHDYQPFKPINIKINVKREKKIACNLYVKDKNNSLNKSLTNKTIINKFSSNKRSKSNNKIATQIENKSFHFDEKTKSITNNLYKNIKEYYNINEININPAISTINFYPNNLDKKNENKAQQIVGDINNYNSSNCFNKKPLIPNTKNNKKDNLKVCSKSNRKDKWIPYQHTFGNLKVNGNNMKNNYNKKNKIIHSTIISPACNSIRKNKNKSLEFDDNDINSIKCLLKFKKSFLHWKHLIIKNKIIKKLRLIAKIKHIITIYKILNIKIFFSKMIQNIYKNAFYQTKINFNYILLNQYYDKLKEISKKKKIINDINIKYNKKAKIKDKNNKNKKSDNKNKKNNNFNFYTESNATAGLYYATQFNQKFNKLLNDRKGMKNNNIIIINNNINNNCQQLINNVKQNKEKGKTNNFYFRKTVNNNSMIDIQPTDTSFSCTMDFNNQSDKSLNSILTNQISEKQKNLINKKNKINYLIKFIKMINNFHKKKVLRNYIKQWRNALIIKKCRITKYNIIDEKIIHFPKSPSPNIINSNINKYNNNYMNCFNYTYENNTNNNEMSNNVNFTYNNSDIIIQRMFTENNIKNVKKNIYGNNTATSLLRNRVFTPSNKYSFYTQYQNYENKNNNFNFINPLPPRITEPKLVYHKKLFPSFYSTSYKQNNNSALIDNNYNIEDRNNISFNNNINMNVNNVNYGNNIINNFYSNSNFYHKRKNYHLDNIDNLLPEEKYGFKKINKIEEREISFSPSLSRKNHSFKNIIKDNYQSINNNNNIYINVVENFRSDCHNNQNINISNLNEMKKINLENNYNPINRSITEKNDLNKLMNHSHSQGFSKGIRYSHS